jgi:hypothetical protein
MAIAILIVTGKLVFFQDFEHAWTIYVNHHDYQDKLKKTQSSCCDSETSRLYIR